MTDIKYFEKTLETSSDSFHPGLSVDCVVFGFHNGNMKVLLNKPAHYSKWMLPGGFVFKDEDLDEAVIRVLRERTKLKTMYPREFHVFGNTARTRLDENREILKGYGIEREEDVTKHWLMQRFASVAYYVLVEYSKVKISGGDSEDVEWFDLDKIPELYSDHNTIIEKALFVIRANLLTLPIGYELLPAKFTMSELRLIYESILDKKLDRRNFQRKILSTGLVRKLDEVTKKFGVKPSALFAFNEDRYKDLLQDGYFMFD